MNEGLAKLNSWGNLKFLLSNLKVQPVISSDIGGLKREAVKESSYTGTAGTLSKMLVQKGRCFQVYLKEYVCRGSSEAKDESNLRD